MQQERLKLRLRDPLSSPGEPQDPRSTVERAIAAKRCVRATYNRDAIELAPHALYLKHGEPYVDGVVQLRNGMPPKEPKLGAFKLAGLGDITSALRRFEPSKLFAADAERYREELIARV